MSAESLLLAVFVGVAVLATLVVCGLVFGLASLVRGKTDDAGPSLADRVAEVRPPRNSFVSLDRWFEHTVVGCNWGFGGRRGVEIILAVAGLAGLLAFVFTLQWEAAVTALVVVGFLTFFVFVAFSHRRQEAIQEQLPDGCYQLSRSVRSGLTLPDAMRETANYSEQPLKDVFAEVAVRMANGLPAKEALERAQDDVRLTDFDTLAAVIALHAESGGNLPALLDRLAAAIRDRNQYRGYFKSVTALARSSAIFIAAAPIVAGILMWVFQISLFGEPLFDRFFVDPRGWFLLAAAAVLWIVGVIWIWALLRKNRQY